MGTVDGAEGTPARDSVSGTPANVVGDQGQTAAAGATPAGTDPKARKAAGTTGWDIMMAINVTVLGLFLLASITFFLIGLLVDLGDPPSSLTSSQITVARITLWLENLRNLVMFGVVPFLWVLGTRVAGWQGTRLYLQLHAPLRSILIGSGLGIVLAAVVIGLVLLLQLVAPMDDPASELFARYVLDWPLVIGLSLVAGVAEEIFFRGFLQKQVGVWGQADIFALFHIGNAPLGPVATLGIGLLFGFIVQRGHSLYVVIAAHVVYDLILLGLALAGSSSAIPLGLVVG